MLLLQTVILLVATYLPIGSTTAQEPAIPVDYQSQILPILESRCFECHNGGEIKGNLRLDSKTGIDERGYSGLPIVAPTADQSELVLRITSDDDEYRMPKSAPALPQNEIDLLTN